MPIASGAFVQRSSIARGLLAACGTAAAVALFATPAHAIISSGTTGFNGLDLNTYLGATSYYSNGFTGTRARIGNLEAGTVWNGHESTTGQNITYLTQAGAAFAPTPTWPASTPNYDWHATQVGMTMIGNGTVGNYAKGIAPGASLVSTAIASSWSGTGTFLGSFNTNSFTIVMPAFNTILRTGTGIGGTVDVSNSSWGSGATTFANGTLRVVALDATIYDSRKVVVFSAGNAGPTTGSVGDPAIAKNNISVGALTGQTNATPFDTVASFSSRGPENFFLATGLQTGTTVAGVRAPVDISAPGDQMTLAAYIGKSGGNLNAATNDLTNNLYFTNTGGTSFAAPIVTAGASLMVDVSKAKGWANGTDGRVIRALLMNSADKTAGWTNNATSPGGVYTTTQGVDWAAGAGRINLTKGYFNQTAGTTDVAGLGGGTINQTGWDYGLVAQGTPNRYQFDSNLIAGFNLTATLSWWAKESYNFTSNSSTTAQFGAQDQLTLQLFQGNASNPGAATLVAQSISTYNLNQHIFFTIPSTGQYFIQVNWAQNLYNFNAKAASENFGLAWSTTVPTPGAGVLVLAGVVAIGRRRR